MPMTINEGLGIAEAIINPVVQHLQNKKARKFQREMYNLQREHALADWNMVNEYNSPREQMRRYREAGLNPNLIYGQSNEGVSVRSASPSGDAGTAPKVDFGGMYDLSLKSSQQDILAKQLELMEEEKKLKVAQQYSTIANTGLTDAKAKDVMFDLGLKGDLREMTMEAKRISVEKGQKEVQRIHNEILNTMELQPGKVKLQLESLLRLRLQNAKTEREISEINSKIRLLNQQWKIHGIEEKLVNKDINPKDPYWSRWFQELLRELF